MRSTVGQILTLLLAVSLLGSSCSHYQLGDTTEIPFTTLVVAPIKNHATIPQLNQVLNHDLRQAFIKSGKTQLTNESGDAQLNVTVTRLLRDVAATQSSDTGLARKYTLTLQTVCELVNNTTDTPYFSGRKIEVSLDVFLDSGQTEAETNAIPLLSKKLSEKIADQVLQVW